jgi:hypothetical protein
MDFELGHTFDSSHSFKLNKLATMENKERSKYHSDYHKQAFAHLVCNAAWSRFSKLSVGSYKLANHAAIHQVSANLLDKTCLDSQTADQATFRKSWFHVPASFEL